MFVRYGAVRNYGGAAGAYRRFSALTATALILNQ